MSLMLGQPIRMAPGTGLPRRVTAPARGLPFQLDEPSRLAKKYARLCQILRSAGLELQRWLDRVERGIPARRGRADAAERIEEIGGQIDSLLTQLDVLEAELEKAGCVIDRESCSVQCGQTAVTAPATAYPGWLLRPMGPALGPG